MRKAHSLFLGLFFIASIPASFAAPKDCSKEETFPTISKTELQEAVQTKAAVVIDVNSEASYKKVHVPGAIHFKANEKNLAKVLPTDKNAMIVSYCGGPACTAWKKAAEKACQLGYSNIRHFKEGIQGWTTTSSN